MFRILPGLPPYGRLARCYPPRFAGEGLVVEFLPKTVRPWTANFRGGRGHYTGVHQVPDREEVAVFASGFLYLVNVNSGELNGTIDGDFNYVWKVQDLFGFIVDRHGMAFIRISLGGDVWHTRRLSFDGFRDVMFTGDRICGLAWYPDGDRDAWAPFEVDAVTGASMGGGVHAPGSLTDAWERLRAAE